MKKYALAPAVIAAIAASGIAFGAASAHAAACPAETIAVSPSTTLTPGQTYTITGHNFSCNGDSTAYIDVFPTGNQQGNGPRVHVDASGSFTYSNTVPAALGTYTVRVGKVLQTKAFTVVGAPSPTTPASAVSLVPTAVPAGHVDVAHTTSNSNETGVALLAAGVVLVGAGATIGARRRPARRHQG